MVGSHGRNDNTGQAEYSGATGFVSVRGEERVMSAVTVAVIVGFVLCALAIRALSTMENGREPRPWESDFAADRVRVIGDTPSRAMMDE
jgi:preprotein translocase subunit SecG